MVVYFFIFWLKIYFFLLMKSLILVFVFIIIKFFMDLFNRIVYVWKCYDRLNNGNNLYLSFNLFVWSLL